MKQWGPLFVLFCLFLWNHLRDPAWQTQSLQKKATAYPSIGQKKLSGAAARMMIFFGAVVPSEIYESHPSDSNRLTSHSNIFLVFATNYVQKQQC